VIAVKKLDRSITYINEELIERVENTAANQCAIYFIHGGHLIVAQDSAGVVEEIRDEKIAQMQRVFNSTNKQQGSNTLGIPRIVTGDK
jgi:uncharacterized protein YlzI (FlbEa/FlbD family)